MRLARFLAFTLFMLGLYSCSCEDVHLGEMKYTHALSSFFPANMNNKGFQMKIGQEVIPISYVPATTNPVVTIPVRATGKTGLKGKGTPSDCMEYYSLNKIEYITSGLAQPVYILIKQFKNVNPEGYTELVDQTEVEDVMEFAVGYWNVFPKPIITPSKTYDEFMTFRYFTLSENPAKLIYKKNDFVQEHLARVTLNGVEHENVYHLYLTSPQYDIQEKEINTHYPLTYIQGIYLKEGIGIIQAYTSKGDKIDFSLKE